MTTNYNVNVAYDLDRWQNLSVRVPIVVSFANGENTHILLSGMSGSGKSYYELQLIAKLVKADQNMEIYFGDYKGDDTFNFLHNCERYHFYKDTTKALDIVYEKLQKRMSGEDTTRHQITLVWDEYVANMLSLQSEDSKFAKKVMNQVSEILLLGRSMGVRFICTCQRPDAVVFPAGSRLNYGIVIILGALVKSTYEMLLPSSEYIEKVENRKFIRGEGVMLLQGVEQHVIKVPTVSNQDMMKSLCKKGLKEGEADDGKTTNQG
jgi:hypothetical protein